MFEIETEDCLLGFFPIEDNEDEVVKHLRLGASGLLIAFESGLVGVVRDVTTSKAATYVEYFDVLEGVSITDVVVADKDFYLSTNIGVVSRISMVCK